MRSRPTSAFGAFSALVLWGFWSSYYGNPFAMAPRGSSIGLVRGAVFMSYTLLGSTVFACLYGLAVLYRRTPALHARFMVSTVCPFLGAATDRITFGYVPLIGFVLGDVLLAALAVWDWRTTIISAARHPCL